MLDIPNFQGNAAVNYTDRETPWTRIIEHKWFEFGKDAEGRELPKTVISREYSSEWKPGEEPYYPVNDEKNSARYEQYRKLADEEKNVIFGGRLGEYRYYDMDAVIASALAMAEKELKAERGTERKRKEQARIGKAESSRDRCQAEDICRSTGALLYFLQVFGMTCLSLAV